VNIKRSGGIAAIALVGALALASCATNEGGGTDVPSGLSGSLSGGGSSAQGSAMEAWVAGFTALNPDVSVSYDPVGSGGGRDGFVGGGYAFGGSDRAFKLDEIAEDNFASCVPGTPIVEMPAYISPIAIVFNLPGIDTLNMDAATVAGIFAGQITTWDDPAITSQNSGVELSGPITAVHRSDDSGTTANFTDYLAEAAPDVWTVGPIEEWPAEFGGEGAPQTSGVFDAVSNGSGTIGYIDASRAADLGTVAVKVGDEYVPYSPEAAAAIVDASPFEEGRSEVDFAIDLDRNSSVSGVYPVVLVSYQIACTDYADDATAELVKAFFSYVVSADGQAAAAEFAGSAPISEKLSADAAAAIAAIK
jgi:phosphate transport system substrate-binding protein